MKFFKLFIILSVLLIGTANAQAIRFGIQMPHTNLSLELLPEGVEHFYGPSKELFATTMLSRYFGFRPQDVTLLWVRRSWQFDQLPDGHMVITEVIYQGERIPYILSISGSSLKEAEVKELIKLYGHQFGHHKIMLPNQNIYRQFVDSQAIFQGLSSFKTQGISKSGRFPRTLLVELENNAQQVVTLTEKNSDQLPLLTRALMQTSGVDVSSFAAQTLTEHELQVATKFLELNSPFHPFSQSFGAQQFQEIQQTFDYRLEHLAYTRATVRSQVIRSVFDSNAHIATDETWSYLISKTVKDLKVMLDAYRDKGSIEALTPSELANLRLTFNALTMLPENYYPRYVEDMIEYLSGEDTPLAQDYVMAILNNVKERGNIEKLLRYLDLPEILSHSSYKKLTLNFFQRAITNKELPDSLISTRFAPLIQKTIQYHPALGEEIIPLLSSQLEEAYAQELLIAGLTSEHLGLRSVAMETYSTMKSSEVLMQHFESGVQHWMDLFNPGSESSRYTIDFLGLLQKNHRSTLLDGEKVLSFVERFLSDENTTLTRNSASRADILELVTPYSYDSQTVQLVVERGLFDSDSGVRAMARKIIESQHENIIFMGHFEEVVKSWMESFNPTTAPEKAVLDFFVLLHDYRPDLIDGEKMVITFETLFSRGQGVINQSTLKLLAVHPNLSSLNLFLEKGLLSSSAGIRSTAKEIFLANYQRLVFSYHFELAVQLWTQELSFDNQSAQAVIELFLLLQQHSAIDLNTSKVLDVVEHFSQSSHQRRVQAQALELLRSYDDSRATGLLVKHGFLSSSVQVREKAMEIYLEKQNHALFKQNFQAKAQQWFELNNSQIEASQSTNSFFLDFLKKHNILSGDGESGPSSCYGPLDKL